MEPYWLFLKTVAHTVLSLLTAAAVLFGTTPAPRSASVAGERAITRAVVLPASLTASSRAAMAATDAGQGVGTLAGRLHAPDALQRARAVSALANALKSADWATRAQAAWALGAKVRRHAAWALGAIRH